MKNSDNIPEPQSPFEQLREVDTNGKELRKSFNRC